MDKIIEKKKVNKKLFYLIKWKGYKNSENTWEPTENLKNIKKMLQLFDKKYKDKEKKNKK